MGGGAGAPIFFGGDSVEASKKVASNSYAKLNFGRWIFMILSLVVVVWCSPEFFDEYVDNPPRVFQRLVSYEAYK